MGIAFCRLLAPHLPAKIIPVSKKVLVTLWLLGNIESFRGVADRFDLGKLSLHRVLFQVCNALKAIRGLPGSVHDARVFRNSPLYTLLENGNLPEDYHLLGDSAYTLQPYMLVPYRDNGHLLPWQVNFNHIHSTSRVVIERAFGLLKSKFRRLQKLEMIDVEISGACVMHNIILMKENLNLDLEIQQDLEVIGHDVGVDNVAAREARSAVVQKRDEIATGLAMHM
ncbi:putative nuclease HARBI1 [Portunus trituberculatus]|uniref:putative nuclease HARBI1 n=1 Tax=Portunus trituberculatus TaxID=210409 RepID=UPI001E1D1F2E|nr:putative nuclease HARBI1 [Portunus trituberculatus]